MTPQEAELFAGLVGRAFYPSNYHTHPCVRMVKNGKRTSEKDRVVGPCFDRVSDAEWFGSSLNEVYMMSRSNGPARTFFSTGREVHFSQEGKSRPKETEFSSFANYSEAEGAAEALNEVWAWAREDVA